MTPDAPVPQPRPMRAWYWFAWRMTRGIYESLFNLRAHGMENVPLTGGLIIASNHVSFLDPHAVGCICPREINYLARHTLFRREPWGTLLRSWNSVPVDLSGKPDIAGMKAILEKLKDGQAVLLFPEGTRTHDGSFLPAKAGVGLLAAKAGVPVLPVRVFGAFELWPRSRKWWRRGQVDVVFGTPARYDAMVADARVKGGREAKEIYQRIADDIMERIKALSLDA
jgi:1-acyl-sn-glycerol-3-phosphate acyltransferase